MTDRAAMEAYLRRCLEFFDEVRGLVPNLDLRDAESLPSHGEPAEGISNLAWALASADKEVPPHLGETIRNSPRAGSRTTNCRPSSASGRSARRHVRSILETLEHGHFRRCQDRTVEGRPDDAPQPRCTRTQPTAKDHQQSAQSPQEVRKPAILDPTRPTPFNNVSAGQTPFPPSVTNTRNAAERSSSTTTSSHLCT
jgi:hypothetical protein